MTLLIAARSSPKRTTIVFENPVDRSDETFVGYSEKLKDHGSVFKTTAYKRLLAAIDMKKVTFAYCRLSAAQQKYIYYTPRPSSTSSELLSTNATTRGAHTRSERADEMPPATSSPASQQRGLLSSCRSWREL